MTGVWWCSNCNVPLLTSKCEVCGTTYNKPVTKDLTPVFAEEFSFLRNQLDFQDLESNYCDLDLWNSGQTYFQNGEKIAQIRYLGNPTPVIRRMGSRPSIISRSNQAKSSMQNLIYYANKSHIDSLELEAIEFIRDCMDRFPNHVPMVTFSGGKDSTIVSHLVRQAFGRATILHVMTDTTIESSHTYAYLDTFRTENPNIPFLLLKPIVSFWDMAELLGPPSRIQRWCCSSHKAAPISSLVSSLDIHNNGVLTFDGIRASESRRRALYERITYKHKVAGEILASPIRSWRDIDVWAYILSHDLHFNFMYELGFRRVGCLPCPLNSRWSDLLIENYYQQEHGKWKTLLFKYASSVGHPSPEQFARESWRVRAGGRGMALDSASLNKETCMVEERTYTYKLTRPPDESLEEYLKPFGQLQSTYDDGIIYKADFIDHNLGIIAFVKIVRPRNTLRIQYAPRKNLRLFVQRFERQLKKFQACVRCGSCSGYCRRRALAVNGSYNIDFEKCTGCLECVKARCIAVESMTKKGSRTWGACNGSI